MEIKGWREKDNRPGYVFVWMVSLSDYWDGRDKGTPVFFGRLRGDFLGWVR